MFRLLDQRVKKKGGYMLKAFLKEMAQTLKLMELFVITPAANSIILESVTIRVSQSFKCEGVKRRDGIGLRHFLRKSHRHSS